MMNVLKKINERIVPVLAAALLGSAVVGIFVTWPMARHLRDLERRGHFTAQDLKEISGLIKTAEDDRLNPQMIALKNVHMVLDEITTLGNAHSVNFLSVVSQDKSKVLYKKINTQAIDLETRSTYQQLSLFMDGLNDLRRGIVLIESFQIVRDTQSPDMVRAKVRLHILLKKEGNGKK